MTTKTPPPPTTEDLAEAFKKLFEKYQASTPAPPTAPVARLPGKKLIGEPKGPCSVEGCPRVSYNKGMCSLHYHRDLRGRPLEGRGSRVKDGEQLPSTVVTGEAFGLVAEAAERNNLSLYRTVRWIIHEWAKHEKLSLGHTGYGTIMKEEE